MRSSGTTRVAAVVMAAGLVLALGLAGCGRHRAGPDDPTPASPSGSVPAAVSGSSSGPSPGSSPGSSSGSSSGSSTGPSTGTAPLPGGETVRPAVPPAGRTTDQSVTTPDGRERTYHVYVPASLPAGPVPLLVALHGGTGWGTQFERNSGFDGLAEANGFVVVYPDGIGAPLLPDHRVWNGGACCGVAQASREDVDDVGFIATVIDRVEASHDIDPARVFAAGHSNGAIMSYRLACELADRIVAIGVQAGTIEIDDCQPSRPVSVLEIHGTADANIPIDGGAGSRSLSRTDFTPPRAALSTMAAADGCSPEPVGTSDAGNPDVTVDTWSPCAAGTEVQWVKVDGANHAWMGHPSSSGLAERVVGSPYPDLDASLTVWTFLHAHPRR